MVTGDGQEQNPRLSPPCPGGVEDGPAESMGSSRYQPPTANRRPGLYGGDVPDRTRAARLNDRSKSGRSEGVHHPGHPGLSRNEDWRGLMP